MDIASSTCRALAKLCIICSVFAVALAAPVTTLHNSVAVLDSSDTHVHLGLISHRFHRPVFAGRKHAAHEVKRTARWTIHAGDTGDTIAAVLGIQFVQLASLNPTIHWSSLQIGSTLNIPVDNSNRGYTHIIVAGDTANTVAVTKAIDLADLAACNPNIDWNDLQIGQKLYIPVASTDTSQLTIPDIEPAEQHANATAHDPGFPLVPFGTVSTVTASSTKTISPFLTPGETLSPSSLSMFRHLKAHQVLSAQAVKRQATVSSTYIVKAGDTGYDIAGRLGITFDVLSEANPGVNWLNLQIGQSLNIPGSVPSATTVVIPIPQATTSSKSSSTSPTANSRSSPVAYVTYSGAITAAKPPYPLISTWIPFAQLWTLNLANIGTTCAFASGSVPPNTASETTALRSAILSVSSATGVNPSFILAVILQESNGCVRVPTTSSWQGVSNPGLMQSFNGRASCNSNGRVQQPCPDYLIQGMITEGVKGNQGVGIVPALSLAAEKDGTQWSMTGSTNVNAQTNTTGQPMSRVNGKSSVAISTRPIDQAMLYYQAARIYNSGSLSADGDLSASTGSTRCYVSDVINRLRGWTGIGRCSLN